MHHRKVSFVLVLLSTIGANSLGVEVPVASIVYQEASLAQLTLGNTLQSPDGLFTFENFSASGSSLPGISSLRIAAHSDGTTAWLTYTVPTNYRVLTDSEAIHLDIAFLASHADPLVELSTVLLDAQGATFGTAGSGVVEVTSRVFDGSAELAAVTVGDYPGPLDDLYQESSVQGVNRWDVQLAIAASPGPDSGSAAVLSDFQLSFGTIRVPEPTSAALFIVCTACLVGAIRIAQHRVGAA